VAILYELDMKIDDGLPNSGRLQQIDENNCEEDDEWNVVGEQIDCAAYWQL